ncbi:MAG: metal ABC transporter permease [Phascolarctobacterium sp.]|nr:metal ABC transporter permease [Phascolarctobacterium sp.]
MLEMFEMEFMQRAWLAGLIMALICPLIGSFLVLRRQSLIGDGLGHIAFAGVAGGALWGYSPVLSAAAATILGALAIERVRVRLSEAADMVLAIFFYSGMGLAVVFTGLNKDGGFNLGSILFGSLMTVSSKDLVIVALLALFTVLFVVLFYRPLQYLTFDETSAKVAGLPVERLNLLLALLTALTVALSMRIVGLLLVSAMMVIPVACALQTARSFGGTIMQSMLYGLLTVSLGLSISYYMNLAPGGTIVLMGTLLFLLSCLVGTRVRTAQPVPGQCQCKVCEEEAAEAGKEGLAK